MLQSQTHFAHLHPVKGNISILTYIYSLFQTKSYLFDCFTSHISGHEIVDRKILLKRQSYLFKLFSIKKSFNISININAVLMSLMHFFQYTGCISANIGLCKEKSIFSTLSGSPHLHIWNIQHRIRRDVNTCL